MATTPKITWTSEGTLRLLEEVKRKPCLWKKSDPKYKNKFSKSAAVKQIAASMGYSADEVKEKFRSLRTIFFQNLKKTKNEHGEVRQPKWEFFNAMAFMSEEATLANKIHSMCSNDLGSDFENWKHSELKGPEAPKTTLKRKHDVDDLASALSPFYEELRKSRAKAEKAKGPNEKFAMEVANLLNNTRDEKLVKRAKARIQIILGELMTESAKRDLAESDVSSNSPSLFENCSVASPSNVMDNLHHLSGGDPISQNEYLLPTSESVIKVEPSDECNAIQMYETNAVSSPEQLEYSFKIEVTNEDLANNSEVRTNRIGIGLESKLKDIVDEVQKMRDRNLFLEKKCEILKESNERLITQNAKLSRELEELRH